MQSAHSIASNQSTQSIAPNPLQVKRAQECEANTGPAQRPDLTGAAAGGASAAAGAAAGAAAAAEEEEVDPLDAFMAEIGQIEKAEGSGKPRIERMEAEDNVEAFVQVRRHCGVANHATRRCLFLLHWSVIVKCWCGVLCCWL